jgi:hypothetical protein
MLMTASNPAAQAKTTGATYVEHLFQTLGKRDPMTVLASTPEAVERSVAGLDETRLRRPEAPGKWSVLEVVQHLADTELVCGYRVRMIVSHPTPDIQGFDQDRWAKELEYGSRRLRDALSEFRSLRESNMRLLRSLGPEKLARYGYHSERGQESVLQIAKLYAGHDLVHLQQIERIKQAVR